MKSQRSPLPIKRPLKCASAWKNAWAANGLFLHMIIGTFHSICLPLLGDVSVISPGDALTVATEVLCTHGSKRSGKWLLQAVSRVKNGATMEQTQLEESLYAAYHSRLQELGMLDFDDLLTQALNLDVHHQKVFPHLLVDEFQDINDTQYSLV